MLFLRENVLLFLGENDYFAANKRFPILSLKDIFCH